jgi:hypothetical protein
MFELEITLLAEKIEMFLKETWLDFLKFIAPLKNYESQK